MNKDILLRTGDKVEWRTGMGNQMLLTGVVYEDLDNGLVDIRSHTKNGVPFIMDLEVLKSKLTLIF